FSPVELGSAFRLPQHSHAPMIFQERAFLSASLEKEDLMKLLSSIALILILASSAMAGNAPEPDGKPHKFTLHDRQFWVDQTPMRVMAGEMHLGRVLPEFWDMRIKQAKAMGLNTISVYLFWNTVESTEGTYAFKDQTD